MRFFVLLGLLISLNTFTSTEIFRIYDGKKIVISGDSCPALMQQAEAILSWSHKLKEHQGTALPECYCNESGHCIVDVYSISPQMVQTYQGVRPEFDGPNCWNRALVFAKILPSLTYTTPAEMTFWMTSPLCRERLLDEELQPGDIIAVRDFDIGEVHGFTYLTDDLAYSKNGFRKKDGAYEYDSLDAVFSNYQVSQKCRRVLGRPVKGEECYYRIYANYFHCQSLEEYFISLNVQISSENMAIYQRLLEIDAEVFSYIFNKNKEIDREYLTNLKYELHGGTLMVKKLLSSNPELSEEEILFWTALWRRANALFEQINYLTAY